VRGIGGIPGDGAQGLHRLVGRHLADDRREALGDHDKALHGALAVEEEVLGLDALEALDVEVLVVGPSVGHTPGDVGVVPEVGEAGAPREGEPDVWQTKRGGFQDNTLIAKNRASDNSTLVHYP